MKIRKASKWQKVLSFFVSMLLMLTIIVSIASLFIKFVVINPDTYLNVLDKNNTYEQIHDFLDGNVGYALTVNNISYDVKENIISVDEVKNQVNKIIGGSIAYLQTGINTVEPINCDKYIERFNTNLRTFIRENAIHVDENINNQILELESDVRKIINNELAVINLDVINNHDIVKNISKVTSIFVSKVYFIPILLVIVLSFLLLMIWRKDYVRLLQWIGNSAISAGLLVFVIFFSGYISKFYEHVIIDTIYLKEFASSVIALFLKTLSIWGALSILIGILLLIPKVRQAVFVSKMKRV